MWGWLVPRTSCDAPQRAVEFLRYVAKRQGERRAPPDQYIIVAGGEFRFRLEPHYFAQPAPDAVALYGIADLLGNSEADPDRTRVLLSVLPSVLLNVPIGILTPQRLQHERLRRRPRASLGHSPKIRPAF
jgi:hypothetical protein